MIDPEPAGRSTRRAPGAAMDGDTFRRAGHALVERVAELLEGIPGRPVAPGEPPDVVRAALDSAASLPEDGADPEAVLNDVTTLLADHSLHNGHPRFFGYITSSAAPIGMLGDLLAAAVNANVGAWTLSPMATEIEAQTVRWIAELMGYQGHGGLMVSGGNMANMVGFWAARAASADWDVRAQGIAGGAPLRVYGSAETHTWIQKAADLSGLGTESVRWIPTSADLRMDLSALRERMEADRAGGERPMMVVGTAGSVSTGAIDDLEAIADLAEEHGAWFHVDGAYGGFAAAVPELSPSFRGMERADSVAVDPHKWLYAPIEAGCTLVRDPESLRAAFAYHPPYYHFGVETTNYVDYGPQNSRGFRALKVWLGLRQLGRRGYVASIAEDIRLSRLLHTHVEAHPELEAVTQGLSITTFRYIPPDLAARRGDERTEAHLNELNEAVLDRLQTAGDAFVSNAVIGGRYVLRACIVNFNTGEEDVAALPGIVAEMGRRVDAELRTRSG